MKWLRNNSLYLEYEISELQRNLVLHKSVLLKVTGIFSVHKIHFSIKDQRSSIILYPRKPSLMPALVIFIPDSSSTFRTAKPSLSLMILISTKYCLLLLFIWTCNSTLKLTTIFNNKSYLNLLMILFTSILFFWRVTNNSNILIFFFTSLISKIKYLEN